MRIIQMHNSTVSQMMGYLLISRQGRIVAIDGGTRGDTGNFRRLVNEHGGHIDLWILTHPHSDHVGVFWEMQESGKALPADLVCYSPAEKDFVAEEAEPRSDLEYFRVSLQKTAYHMHMLRRGEIFKVDNITIEILKVVNPNNKKDWINNLSVVFKVTEEMKDGKCFSMLFLGDLGPAGGKELLKMYGDPSNGKYKENNGKKENKLKADAVQMAHHGQNGVEFCVYEAISPLWAFWPTPDWLWSNTPKGEPEGSGPWKTLEVRSWMESLGALSINSIRENAIFDTEEMMYPQNGVSIEA